MPQASRAMRKYWGGASDQPAMTHLISRGFILTSDWEWAAPHNHIWTEKDMNAISFLIEEWDFNGLTKDSPTPNPESPTFERLGWEPWKVKDDRV